MADNEPSTTPHPLNGSLWVGDLGPDVSEQQLYEVFAQIGQVQSVRVCRDALTRRSLGYAYVNYQSVTDAVKGLEDLNHYEVNGKAIRVMPSQRDPSNRKSGVGNIFIKVLKMTIWQDLSSKIAIGPGGESKGHGFVQYEDEASAQAAIDTVNGKELVGQQVFVGPFKRREDRDTGVDKFTNLYVKNLDESVTDETLQEVFGAIGALSSAVVMKDDEGKSKGFGFVNYEKSEDAHAAVEKLNGHKQGETEWEDKREKQDKLAESNLYIKNLDDSQTDDKLRQLFEEFGTIMSCKVLRDPNTGISRGVGFVQLSTPEEATKAINEMNTKLVNNKPLYVAIAQKKSDRQRRLKTYFQQPQANFQNPQGMGMGMPFYGPGPQTNMNGPMGYGYPNQYGGPMSGMGGNMRPAYGTPNGMPGGMMPGMGRPPMMNNYNNYGNYGNNYGNYGMPPMMQQPPPPMYGGPGRGGMGPRGRGHPAGRMGPGARGPARGGRGGRGDGPMGMPNMSSVGPGSMAGPPQMAGAPQLQMNGTSASAIHALPASLPGQSASALTQKLAATQDSDQRRTMLGEELYPLVLNMEPDLAGKITGMLLEMSEGDVIAIIEDHVACQDKVGEAKRVLIQSGQVPGDENSNVAGAMAGLAISA
ncbi:MAG: poly(A) binding 8 [Trebouxia sp. A1-2]|nr:MAG: poly(A) binding 8 [Trebouxia sp. A1-2]